MVRETEISSQAASVPIYNTTLINIAPMGDRVPYLSQQVPLSTVSAIYDGLLQTSRYKTLFPSCPSGNYTFPTYQSLGVCNKCIDISDKMKNSYSQTRDCITGITSDESVASLWELSFPCKAELPGYGVSLEVHMGLINTTIDLD